MARVLEHVTVIVDVDDTPRIPGVRGLAVG
jgi:hypothetical protein